MHLRNMAAWVSCTLLLAATLTHAQAACSSSSPLVGATGELSELEHQVAGTVTVISDCAFRVDGFSYDGKAPSAYFRCAKGDSDDDLKSGKRASDVKLTQAVSGVTATYQLRSGLTWEDCTAISVWCETFAANFGSTELSKPAGVPMILAAPPASPSTMAPPPAPTNAAGIASKNLATAMLLGLIVLATFVL